ncbi:hypothetical protein HNR60_003701 [Rhodopseudomonas rhenobacensis]|uniref:Uncharacterized protein n=1 Tax=Rhodopseudomonas rhenobacensis TaxID=87461 RepID=A0A7W7Z6X9_9BRAD|nr:hypothetical protein [Rhodopseudomonas rhenobacensis]MBB5048930.1 hypothetical protein [Rhodopseudomonas rhenobacensis]
MNKLIAIRSQEAMCRERALRDPTRRAFWSAKAEEWQQIALAEIAFHFRECNVARFATEPATAGGEFAAAG